MFATDVIRHQFLPLSHVGCWVFVESHYFGWILVTDPRSTAAFWMKHWEFFCILVGACVTIRGWNIKVHYFIFLFFCGSTQAKNWGNWVTKVNFCGSTYSQTPTWKIGAGASAFGGASTAAGCFFGTMSSVVGAGALVMWRLMSSWWGLLIFFQ